MENVKKCKNFLSTLIKLAHSQPENTVKNVQALIQGLIVSYDFLVFFLWQHIKHLLFVGLHFLTNAEWYGLLCRSNKLVIYLKKIYTSSKIENT